MALDYHTPDYEFYLNVEHFNGKNIRVECDNEIDIDIRKSDTSVSDNAAYIGKYRPLAHFTVKRGWLNDPNGLVFYHGKYLMFYQHNPVACTWENMHWGYAVSDDLVHWKENDVILLFYTAAGSTSETAKNKPFTQCLSYSIDGGKRFQKYDKNPLIEQIVGENRDPKVIYHEATDSYIMVFYLDNHEFVLYSSKNLLDWSFLQKISLPEDAECPDFYPLCVDGNIAEKLNYGNNSYAAQSWSDVLDGRRIRTAFATVVIPSMPFGSCMNIPQKMSLKTISGEVCLCAEPVQEIQNLYLGTKSFDSISVNSVKPFLYKVNGKCFDISLNISCQDSFRFSLFGLSLEYNNKNHVLKCLDKEAPLKSKSDSIELRIIIDTVYAEIFADNGSVFMGMSYIQDRNLNTLKIESAASEIVSLTLSEMGAFWKISD